MLDPAIRVRREVRVLAEDIVRSDVLFELHQKTVAADARMQWIEGLHVIELMLLDMGLTEGRHSQVNQRRLDHFSAESTVDAALGARGGRVAHIQFLPTAADARRAAFTDCLSAIDGFRRLSSV